MKMQTKYMYDCSVTLQAEAAIDINIANIGYC